MNRNSVIKHFPCSSCESAFSNFSNLKRHVLKLHPSEVNKLESLPRCLNNNFVCEICSKKFMYKSSLKVHERSHEPGDSVPKSVVNNQKCPLCDFTGDKTTVINHYKDVHDIIVLKETICFDSTDNFECWKNDFEKVSKARFVKEYCSKSSNRPYEYVSYICHRSGKYIPEGKGLRHLKTQGTNKIGALCPANIKLQVKKNDGTCKVFVTKTHVGHACDVGHLSLTPVERKQLSIQIAAKVPLDDILDQVRDSIMDGNLQRLHLLTKKDLYNIENSFNLNSSCVRHANDVVSVESWVKEMQQKSDAILFYKMQDLLMEDWPELKSEDFLLAIMTEAQCEMLKLYSSDVVCIDGTHGCNNYDYELITLMVVDDMRQGFPCAFLITSRSDTVALKIFFNCIKSRIGTVSVNIFMSDMAEQFINAWLEVMNPPKLRLYCTWHLDRAWRKNLHKIKTKDKQVVVYKLLRTVLQETDVSAFDKMVESLYTSLHADEDTKDFAEYFKIYYMENPTQWAYCHRIGAGINTNMYLERMHRTLKHIYFRGKNIKRLDKAINGMMRLVRDKCFDRLIVLNKGKITHKLKLIRARHKNSISLNADLIIRYENGWNIPSSTTSEIYFVQKLINNCDCQLICSDCETCIHKFFCSCIDSAIKYNMCKHIHLLCQFLKTENTIELSDATLQNGSEHRSATLMDVEPESINLEIVCNKREAESQAICELLSIPSTSKGNSLASQKDLFFKKVHRIIEGVETQEELEAMERFVNPMEPTLEAMRNQKSSETHFVATSNFAHNKKIDPQKRFYSTKKKPGRKPKKIETIDSNKIAINLIKSVE